jgi:SAM-dependent methyltransferase
MTGTNDMDDLRQDWDDLASVDPLWAVNSQPDKKHRKWSVEDFLATGLPDVERILADSERLQRPPTLGSALDFGCGAGRLSYHLAADFRSVEAVDISVEMVAFASRLHRGVRNLRFSVNPYPDLRIFADESFDMICSIAVLQHLPSTSAIERYVAEFVRVIKLNGLIAFQLPEALRPGRRLLTRRIPYRALRWAGLNPEFLYGRFGLHPMQMTAMEPKRVSQCIRDAGGTTIDVVKLSKHNNMYYATRAR